MTEPTSLPAEPAPGRFITFYSYKGGTGRSMAVANVAWILASQGRRVLVIDWDLEAPGLHRYFHPFIDDKELGSSPGLIDFFVDFVEGTRLSQKEPDGSEGEQWFERYTNLLPYAFSLNWEFPKGGTLDFVPAGQQGVGYGVRVMTFNWQAFYDQLGGGVFLEAVKRHLRGEYDYILIDSRTGISDTSGICTVQMPDALVVCFTLNNQSIRGAAAVAESAYGQRRKPMGEPALRVWPLPTRVELGEKDKLELGRAFARSVFDRFLDPNRLPSSKEDYWGRVETLYFPWYAYEEVLAPFGDKPKESNSLLAAAERLTAYLTDGAVTELWPPPEEERLKWRDRFARSQPPVVEPYDVFVLASPEDNQWAREELVPQLEAVGLKVLLSERDYKFGVPRLLNLEEAVNNSRRILLVMTPAFLSSEWGSFESLLATTRDPSTHLKQLLPVMVQKCELPLRLALLSYADFTDPARRGEVMARLLRELGSTAGKILPQPVRQESRETALRGLAALSELMSSPDVREAFASLRTIYQNVLEHVRQLYDYKSVHDLLHELQVFCYTPMFREATQFPSDDGARENLADCELSLAVILDKLQSFLERSPQFGQESVWFQSLRQGHRELRGAIAGADLRRLQRAQRLLRGVLAVQPTRINAQLTTAAQNLQVPRLIDALTSVRDRLATLGVDPQKVSQLHQGIEALKALFASLTDLVREHDLWQEVDDQLRRIEDDFEHGLDELGVTWPELRALIERLVARHEGRGAESLRAEAERVEKDLSAGDLQKVRRSFRRFRSLAASGFYDADRMLLKLCNDLRVVVEPLASVLKIIS